MFPRIFLFALIFILLLGMATDSNSQQKSGLLAILDEAEQLKEQGRTTEALKLLDKVDIVSLEKETLILQEKFLWARAMSNLDFADELRNRNQYIPYAERAHGYWQEYINWYHQLSKQNKDKLDSLGHKRIKMATAHLGNSIIRMEEPRRLFKEYSDIRDVQYLGEDAIDLWEHWLYACPDMKPIKLLEYTDELLWTKVCNNKCTNDWLYYAETLAEWAQVEYLREEVRGRKLEEAYRIKEIAENCQNHE